MELDEEDLARFRETRRATRGFRPVPLKLRLSEGELASLAVNRHRFPGVEVVPYLTRRYPYGDLFAHVIGYVGRVDVADLEAMGDSRNAALTHIGKAGIERFYEDRLRGEIGYEEVETNVEGRALGVLRRHDAKPGNDLTLTVDARLQQAMVDAFEGQHGAAIAIDPASGEILGMVSLPSYDPNLFINGIGHKDWQALQAPARPLFNRNVLGGVPPGSTIKPFMALAALVFGKWRPWNAMAACLLFGFLDAVAIRLQGVSIGGFAIPVQAIEALPYILTVFLLAGFIGKAVAPKALGTPYVKERE